MARYLFLGGKMKDAKMKSDFVKDTISELKKSRIGKVLIEGLSNVLANTIDEAEKVATDFTTNQLKKRTKKIKENLKSKEDVKDGNKENT